MLKKEILLSLVSSAVMFIFFRFLIFVPFDHFEERFGWEQVKLAGRNVDRDNFGL